MFEFVHQTVTMLALHGSAYIYAPRRSGELPPEMRNLHPSQVKGLVHGDTDEYAYQVGKTMFSERDVRAIYWMLMPGQLRGVSPLEAQRNTIGIGLAMDRFIAQFYGEGATPSSVLETDTAMTAEQAQVLRETWQDAHVRHRRPAVLTGGLKWRAITTSASEMQLIEYRESVIRDIARVYRIPLNLIIGSGGDTQTYQNVEQAGINFVRYTLLPWMRRLEDAISDTLPLTQRVRFNTSEFERADVTTRVKAQQIQILSGTLSPNEARQQENREPYPGGDAFVTPSPLPSAGTDAQPPE
jgi:HK97 family phage portal protein